jgi:hypothetical protein
MVKKKVCINGMSSELYFFSTIKILFTGLNHLIEIGNKTYYLEYHIVSKEDAIAKCDSFQMDLVSFEDVQEYKDVTAWLLEQGNYSQ